MGKNGGHRSDLEPSVSTILLQLDHISGQFGMKLGGPANDKATEFYGLMGLGIEQFMLRRIQAQMNRPLVEVPRIAS